MGFIGDEFDSDNCRFKFEMEGKKQLYVFGVNPSTAQGKVDSNLDWVHNYVQSLKCSQKLKGVNNNYAIDPTIMRVKKFVTEDENYKFDGFVMLNICAQRTSKPKDLVQNDNLSAQNKDRIKLYLNDKENIDILLAFGDAIGGVTGWKFNYFKEIVNELLKPHNPTYYVLEDPTKETCLTKKGNPRHPSPGKPSHLTDATHLLKIEGENNPLAKYTKWDFLK